MAWFDFLKEQGYFNPENNPSPVPVEKGHFVSYWESLDYLEKLSEQIKDGKEVELIGELLSIIKDVSTHPKDNYKTWFRFIRILVNLPNESIDSELLDFIPTWLSGKFDTNLQSSELCDRLLPKFLNESSTELDIEKAELIIRHLFHVKFDTKGHNDVWDKKVEIQTSRVYLYCLTRAFENKELLTNVVKYCSEDIVLYIGNCIAKLFLDYPSGATCEIESNGKKYTTKVFFEENGISLIWKDSDDNSGELSIPLDAKNEEILEKTISTLEQQGIESIIINESFGFANSLETVLNHDPYSSIKDLSDSYHSDDEAKNTFSLIFRDLVNETVKVRPERGIRLLKSICNGENYHRPFFKRIALYVISENWDVAKEVFWSLIRKDGANLFSHYKFREDLYELLSKNQVQLTDDEKGILLDIFETKLTSEDDEDLKYEQLRWYTSLREVQPFDQKHNELSSILNIPTDHYENQGKVRLRSGSISPISVDDLIEKSNEEIVDILRSFKPTDSWDGPNVEGLAKVLEQAVENEPDRFADRIDIYVNLPYTYLFSIFHGFIQAHEKNKDFHWESVLDFCLLNLNNPDFKSGNLIFPEDRRRVSEVSVVQAIADLISTGTKNDKNSFDLALLPKAKEIIQSLADYLEPTVDFKEPQINYPTYTLNSTSGKILTALLYYSLRRARNFFQFEDNGKWEPELKSIFEKALLDKVIDAYIIEGLYFEQFCYLDKDWITVQVNNNKNIAERDWFAFMNGLIFGQPPFNQSIYELCYFHYEKIIQSDLAIKSIYNNGLVRHFVAFYFWKYEDLSSKKLVYTLLKTGKPDLINEFIRFVAQQPDYPKGLSHDERSKFEKLIFELWDFIIKEYQNPKNDDERKLLALMLRMIEFFEKIDEAIISLVITSLPYIDSTFEVHDLLENLDSLKDNGPANEVAKLIGEVLIKLELKDVIHRGQQLIIIDLVSFLFENGQNDIAKQFCNKMAIDQQFFLNETYLKYT